MTSESVQHNHLEKTLPPGNCSFSCDESRHPVSMPAKHVDIVLMKCSAVVKIDSSPLVRPASKCLFTCPESLLKILITLIY